MFGYINNHEVQFEENETILSVARRYDIFIPTLCTLDGIDHTPGTCRVCLVDITKEGEHYMVTSCNTPMEEGMKVQTRTPAVRAKQRLQVELLLADHNQDCASCIRHGHCELQDVAQFVGLQQTRYHYPEFYEQRTRDTSSPAVIRDMSKCIRCFRCVKVCRDVQGIDALVVTGEGLSAEVGVRDNLLLDESNCVSCGQCVLVCPVGALAEKDDIESVNEYLYDPEITTVFQFAPAVRTALGEAFRMPEGENVEGRIIAAIRRLGADIVLDTNFAADLVIMEEGTELLGRIRSGGRMPMFTSCCPAWVNLVEKQYPEMMENVSTTRSPQQCFGSIAKSYLAEKMGIDPKKMRVISIMPCLAKKGEAKRSEFVHDGLSDVDAVITTREFARLIKREAIHLDRLEPEAFDNPLMGEYSGAAVIFGTTGGVMEAAVRTLHHVATGEELEDLELSPVRGMDRLREASIDLGEELGTIDVAVVHSLKTARKLLADIKEGKRSYHFVEVMACPGGCVGGGGQPRNNMKYLYQAPTGNRREGLFDIDRATGVRQSHNNPLIRKLYDDYLGEPNSEKSHHLLHTAYNDRSKTSTHSIKEIWEEIRRR